MARGAPAALVVGLLLAAAGAASARLGVGEPLAESCGFMESLVESNFPSADTNIFLCIGFHESSYIPSARNPSGATGLFQVRTRLGSRARALLARSFVARVQTPP